jgi:REP element-mobilizing transposase RayT
MSRPPRIPVLLPLEKTVVYFITINVQNRLPVLANAEALAALREVAVRLQERWILRAAMLMPDHLHLMAMPLERHASVSHLSGAIKRWMRQLLKAGWKWQEGCFDHLLRSPESADAKWEYVRQNPVRAGLVTSWEDWPYQIGLDPEHPIATPGPVTL